MTIGHKFTNTRAKSLLELLQSNARFIVPRFQRNYSWNVEKVRDLWSDVVDNFHTLNSGDEQDVEYLLGPMVMLSTKEFESYHVIDGQQRLATLTLLFCVARDIILEDTESSDHKPAGFHKIIELIENQKMEQHASWKLELNDTDREFFREIQEFERGSQSQLERIKAKKVEIQSLKFLKENYIFLHEKITQSLYTNFGQDDVDVAAMSPDEKKKKRIDNRPNLMYFLTHLRENNYLIHLVVSDDSSAFQIFETLNERGQTLSKSSLIKNRILNTISDNPDLQKEQSDKWNKIFDDIVRDQPDDDFIIESYHSRDCDDDSLRTKNHDAIKKMLMSKKNLYKVIKRIVTNEDECRKFIKELEQDAKFLSTLNDPTKYSDTESRDDVYSIRALNAKLIRIPILAASRKWRDNPHEYSALVRLLIKFFFKTRVVSRKYSGEIEKTIPGITKMINEGCTFENIRNEIMKYDNHVDFKEDFKKRFVRNPHKDAAKYALRQITISLGSDYADVKPIDNLTLEHILPLNPQESWNKQAFFAGCQSIGDIEEYKRRLGNMTLLTEAINSKIQNQSFDAKKNHTDKNGKPAGYNTSQLLINEKTVRNEVEWTALVIKKREEKFTELADKIWKLD